MSSVFQILVVALFCMKSVAGQAAIPPFTPPPTFGTRPASNGVADQGESRPIVYDCLVGATACRNSTNYVSNGRTVECCRPGDSISSSFTARYNTGTGSQMQHICKCSPGGLAMINGRPMTPKEKQQFTRQMNSWSSKFRQNMNRFFTNLNDDLANMFNRWNF